jgi:hypothetical protein
MARKSDDPRWVLGFVLAFSLALRLYYAWQPLSTLLQRGIADDAFYYFGIARNLARGLGPTFDGLHLTNGFHPLYALIITPFFYLFPASNELVIHLSLTLLVVCAVLATVPLCAAVSRVTSGWAGLFAAVLWLFNPWALIFTLGGVETAVYILCASLAFWQYVRAIQDPTAGSRRWIALGACLGLVLLARSDGLFLLFAILADLVWEWIRPGDAIRRSTLMETIRTAALVAVTCLLVFSPWLIWSLAATGSPMQVSGQAVYWHTHAGVSSGAPYLAKMSQSINRTLFGAILFSGQAILPAVLLLAASLLFRRGYNPSPATPTGLPALRAVRLGRVAFLYILFLVLAYGLYLWQQQFWYFTPIMLAASILGGLAFQRAGDLLAARNLRFAQAVLALTAAAVLLVGFQTWRSWQNGSLRVYPAQTAAVRLAGQISALGGPGTLVGAWNAGILGYLADGRLVGLDGVVNNGVYTYARRRGISLFDLCGLWPYIQEEGIDYLTDYEDIWSEDVEQLFAGRLELWEQLPAGDGAQDYRIKIYRVLPAAAPMPSCLSALKVSK